MLIVQLEAEADLRDAWTWYEDKQWGLGEEFLLEVDRVFGQIEANPTRFPIAHRTARKCSVRRFPYIVLYVKDGSNVIVLGVFHQRLNPKTVIARAI